MRVNWNRAAGITGHLILVCPVLFVACDSETKKGAAGGSRSGIESGSHVVTISTDRDLQRDLISITGTDSAASERIAIVDYWASKDPLRFAEELSSDKSIAPSIRILFLSELLCAWAERDTDAVSQFLGQTELREVVVSVCALIAKTDPWKAGSVLIDVGDPLILERAFSEIARVIGIEDWRIAVSWAASNHSEKVDLTELVVAAAADNLANSGENDSLLALADEIERRFAETDHSRYLSIIGRELASALSIREVAAKLQHFPLEGRLLLLTDYLRVRVNIAPHEAVEIEQFVRGIELSDRDRKDMFRRIARGRAGQDPESALAWAQSFPEGDAARPNAIEEVVAFWLRQDSYHAGEYIGRMVIGEGQIGRAHV